MRRRRLGDVERFLRRLTGGSTNVHRSTLPAIQDRLATIREDASLVDAATQLARSRINLVVACRSDATIAGVITKTDVVRQISQCTPTAPRPRRS